MLERLRLEKLTEKKAKARLRHLPPSIDTREDLSFRHGQVTLPFRKLTNQEDIDELKIPKLENSCGTGTSKT